MRLLIFYYVIQYLSEAISDYGAQSFALNGPSASLPLITCSSPHITGKGEYFLHLPGHLLLTLGAVFTTHGFIFMDETYQFLECYSHGLNPQEPFCHLSVDFSFSTWV